jgi:hypothetical protein
MASSVSFSINPITLANMLTNAVEISKETARIEHPQSLLLAYQPSPDGKVGQLLVYGCGRYAAGRTVASLEGLPSDEAISLSITRDHAAELSTALRKTSRAADTRVGVALHSEAVEGVHPETGAPTWGNLVVAYGDKQLGHLHDSDVHGKYDNVWQRVDDLAAATGDPIAGVALHVGVLNRVSKLKGVGEVADLRTTPLPGVIAAKLGTGFVALLGEVNKQAFISGGRHGEGPGTKEQVWSQ